MIVLTGRALRPIQVVVTVQGHLEVALAGIDVEVLAFGIDRIDQFHLAPARATPTGIDAHR
jgi:hypothetical protein